MSTFNKIFLIAAFSLLFTFTRFNLTLIARATQSQKLFTVYLINQSWHTGIVFLRKEIDTTIWHEVNQFKYYKYIDVGWGEAEFYQNPGFNLFLAVKALFASNPSTLRISGFNMPIEDYINFSDHAIELFLSREQLNKLSLYIHQTYFHNKNGNIKILSENSDSSIIFYKANGRYDMFRTCNTWVADALRQAGFKNISGNIILVGSLFKEAGKIGKTIK